MKTTADITPRVLIVDDDSDLLTSFKIWLEGEGFDSLTALNSDEAVKILENHRVDVALLDFRLETENGLQVAEKLIELDADLPIIIITGYPSHDIAVEAMKSGLFDYLSKGSSNDKILASLNRAVNEREKKKRQKTGQTPSENVIRFMVICKHSLIKERLQAFSANYPDFKLVRTFRSIGEAKTAAPMPEVDIAMVCATCCIDNFDEAYLLFNDIYHLLPTVKPLLFNDYFSEEQKVELIKMGIKGFFSVEMDTQHLLKALTLINQGDIWVSRRLANQALPHGPEYLKNYLARNVDSFQLSDREKDILKAMIMGLKNREIADRLFISENTVKTHVNKIFKKLDVTSRSQAVLFATENQLL